jgi:hypothetical protein
VAEDRLGSPRIVDGSSPHTIDDNQSTPMSQRLIFWFALVSLTLAGCQGSQDAVDATPSAIATAQAAADERAELLAAAHESSANSSKRSAVARFDPPFPNRTDMFQPPREGRGTVRRDDEYSETIELKGFVDVDGPQVVLSIDGMIMPIPEGGEKYGVQVISIDPPSAVLQRGRNRWTASLQ